MQPATCPPARDARGLFRPGAPAGPGRPRKAPRSARGRLLLDELRDVANHFLERHPETSVDEVLEAADAFAVRVRGVRRTERTECPR